MDLTEESYSGVKSEYKQSPHDNLTWFTCSLIHSLRVIHRDVVIKDHQQKQAHTQSIGKYC